MKKLIFILPLIWGFSNYALTQVPSNDMNWEAVFIDDFNTLDLGDWEVLNNFDHYGEPQMYTNRTDNVYINNGNLILKIIKENYMGHSYTSGWINAKTKYQYGYFEIRCKLPTGKGFWPAFWLHDGSCSGGNYNEIDIFEMDGSYPTLTTNNLHNCIDPSPYAEQPCPNYSTAYHNYSVEWTPTRIVWYLDDNIIRSEENIYGIIHPQTLIVNLAIFPWDLPNNSTPFPSYMYVDHIKIYQLKMDCNAVVNDISNFNTFNYAVKKSISLGSSTSVPNNSKITLRATDYLEMDEGFEIPLGTEFTLYATSCY